MTTDKNWLVGWVAAVLLGVAASRGAAAPASYQAQVLSDNPLLYYQFSELAGDAINLGSLGASHNAAYNGAITRGVATLSGDTGITFNGVADFLESLAAAPAGLTGNPTFTAETIVRIPTGAAGQNWAPFLHWGAGGTGQEVYFSIQNDNEDKVYAGFYNAGLRMQGNLTRDAWAHVVWVRQGGGNSETGSTVYINGAPVPLEVDTDLCCSPLIPNVTSNAFRINRARDFTRFFTGSMDELVLYDTALTPQQVTDHFNAFVPEPGAAAVLSVLFGAVACARPSRFRARAATAQG